ncbi:hypothetical protein ACF08B_40150 [Streptomyces sp. NPDC015139]|uniref:hypothetical protein n=1 Tax=Streptomyces sp. NPDC015139 TaxID=3364942 RepID=UPI0036FFB353
MQQDAHDLTGVAVPLVVLPYVLQQRGQQDVRMLAQWREDFVRLRPARIALDPTAPGRVPERLDQGGEAAGVGQPGH